MKTFLFFISAVLFLFNQQVCAQSYIEGPDLPGTGTGPAFSVAGSGPSISIQGTLNTPTDGQDRFQIVIPDSCEITGVTYLITDTFQISVNGFAQFGTNNQVIIPPLTGSFSGGPSGPFPVVGPVTLDCMMSANIAANDIWFMVFFKNCGGCINPDVPLLGPDQFICLGDQVTFNISNANLNDATDWEWYQDSCGQTNIGSGPVLTVTPTSTTNYFVRGEGGCVTPGPCGSISAIVNVIDTGVTVTGSTLNANTAVTSYQWLDCNNGFSPIAGATNQMFNPGTGGSYAVQLINTTGCIDTSSCHTVLVTGTDQIEDLMDVTISPNPVTDILQFKLNVSGNVHLIISDIEGRIIISEEKSIIDKNKSIIYDFSTNAKGVYFMQIRNNQHFSAVKIIKQ